MDLHFLHSFLFHFKIVTFCFVTFLLSVFLTSLVRSRALHKSILDIPNERSSHQEPTPRGGGIAIAFIFTLTVVFLGWKNFIPPNLVYALAGGVAIAAIGYCDDIYNIKIRWRLLVHFAIAVWALYWLNGFTMLDIGTWKIELNWNGILLAIIGIVWCINLYNFMDGIDGLAGSEGIFVALSSGIVLWFLGMPNLSILIWLLASIIAGFTVWNWQPAKIFLGDVGSGYLGYIFAILAIYTANNQILPISFWAILLAIFLCDATFTVIHRARQGKGWHIPHREFFFHLLIAKGFTHKQISTWVLIINCFILFPAAYASLCWQSKGIWFLGIPFFCLWMAWILIRIPGAGFTLFSLKQLKEDG